MYAVGLPRQPSASERPSSATDKRRERRIGRAESRREDQDIYGMGGAIGGDESRRGDLRDRLI